MANPQDELEALRAQVASLTARVHRLEQSTGIEPQFPGTTAAATPPPPPMPHIPPRPNVAAPTFAQMPQRSSEDLEGTIGKLWLNRIGIVAILIGVAYFLKYADRKSTRLNS